MEDRLNELARHRANMVEHLKYSLEMEDWFGVVNSALSAQAIDETVALIKGSQRGPKIEGPKKQFCDDCDCGKAAGCR